MSAAGGPATPVLHPASSAPGASRSPQSTRLARLNYLRAPPAASAEPTSQQFSEQDLVSIDTLAQRARSGSSPAPAANTSRRQRRGLRQHHYAEAQSALEQTQTSLNALQITEGWLPTVDGSPALARPTTQVQPVASTTAPEQVRPSSGRRAQRSNRSAARQRASSTPYAAGLTTSVPEHVFTRDFAALTEALAASAGAGPVNSQPIEHQPTIIPVGKLPTIQFVAAQDAHSPRPSLHFSPVSRTLPSANSVIRVGRYSEKEGNLDIPPNVPSDAPIGFKSKVVSRRHCEFFYADSQWYIKDVKSSSGTFLNHIRLSQPGQESRPYPIKDGDVVQLGIDFKGGEEMIFRCVKMRIQCNRGWQKGINKFNKSAHKAIQDLAKGKSDKTSETASKHSTECTICLNSIAPCQPLFVAPCSHTWHYKCIRPILEDPRHPHFQYPLFLCPNCRAVADLEADIEDPQPFEEPDTEDDQDDDAADTTPDEALDEAAFIEETKADVMMDEDGLSRDVQQMFLQDFAPQLPPLGLYTGNGPAAQLGGSATSLNPNATDFIPVPSASDGSQTQLQGPHTNGVPNLTINQPSTIRSKTSSSSAFSNGHPFTEDEVESLHDSSESASEPHPLLDRFPGWSFTPSMQNEIAGLREGGTADGPLTPRNTAGPFVFDGGGSNVPTGGVAEEDGNQAASGSNANSNKAAPA